MARYTLTLPDEINDRLDQIAAIEGISKAEVMKKAFALISIAYDEKRKGRALAIIKVNEDGSMTIVGKIIGL